MPKRYNNFQVLVGNLSKLYKKSLSQKRLEIFLYNPYPFYKRMRSLSPVLWSEQFKHFLVFDYDSVLEVMSDQKNFSNESLETFNLVEENRDIVAPFFKIMGEWLVLKDDPRHSEMRNILARAFTPKYLSSIEEDMEKVSLRHLNKVKNLDNFDFHNDFSVPFASEVFMKLLGVNHEDLDLVEPWIKDLALVVGRTKNVDYLKRGVKAIMEMKQYLERVIEEKKRVKTNDMISLLVEANKNGVLTDSEISSQAIMLLSGGFETVSASLSGGVMALLKNKNQLDYLMDNPQFISKTIEEIFRFVSPAQAPTRVAKRDINFHGIKIKKGQGIAPVVASANRDKKYFENPEFFDLKRNSDAHLAMGKGVHHCIGASLSRMQLKIVFKNLLDHQILTNLNLESEVEDWNTDNFSFRLPKSVKVQNALAKAKCPYGG